MTCKELKNRIIRFDQLDEREQILLLEHIEVCPECQSYFDRYLTLEEGLDLLIEDKDIQVTLMKKKAFQRIFKRTLLTCASLFLLFVGAWSTPPVKAAIEKALNEVLIEYFLKSEKPLEGINENSPTEKITYAELTIPNGRSFTIYSSGQKSRTEYNNGDFKIFNGKFNATYSKKDNLFLIQEYEHQSGNILVDTFKEIDSNSITFKGEEQYLDRLADVYLVYVNQNLQREYWFDKDTHLFIREVEIYKGERRDKDRLKEFKIIEVKKNHRLFDFIAPDGARIIDETNQ